MLGGADNPNGELPSYITGANNLEDLRTGKKEALPKDDDGCTGSNAVFGVITHIINDARSGEFDDCPVM
ncbi:DNA repair protein [Escherichia coli]|nr:DNA repair protein [Escherichia coli]